jgi:hypothetical protein
MSRRLIEPAAAALLLAVCLGCAGSQPVACSAARPAPVGSEPRAGVVVAVIHDLPVVVGVAAVCASQTEPCSHDGAGLVP